MGHFMDSGAEILMWLPRLGYIPTFIANVAYGKLDCKAVFIETNGTLLTLLIATTLI